MQTTLETIRKSIEVGKALEEMAEVYAELSVIRLDRIRVKIERNRIFALQLSQTFHEVRYTAAQFKLPPSNKKPAVSLIVCSNLGFFLNMEIQLARNFMGSANVGDDVLVIGRSGSEILRSVGYTRPFDMIIFGHDLPTPVELNRTAEKILPYERVTVFFPQFHSVGVQEPAMVDISGGVTAKLPAAPVGKQLKGYILEPEAPKMLEFFENQIMRLLLEQTILEAELSRVAARLLMMDSSRDRAEKFVRIQDILLRVSKKQKQGVKILEQSLGYLARKKNYDQR